MHVHIIQNILTCIHTGLLAFACEALAILLAPAFCSFVTAGSARLQGASKIVFCLCLQGFREAESGFPSLGFELGGFGVYGLRG